MSSPSEWLRELGEAAEELQYGILVIEPGRIDLERRQDDVQVRIESHFLSGKLLRQLLHPPVPTAEKA